MKLLKTFRADPSDTFVFEHAARPGEWAVSGAFTFTTLNPQDLTGKPRAAFRGGFLGIESLGRSTLAQVVEASLEECRQATDTLAKKLVELFGAPDLLAARPAAEEEIAFAASLSHHPVGTLVALARRHENGETRESFRTLSPRAATGPIRVFAMREESGAAAEGFEE
jgi:hypothetical protein